MRSLCGILSLSLSIITLYVNDDDVVVVITLVIVVGSLVVCVWKMML